MADMMTPEQAQKLADDVATIRALVAFLVAAQVLALLAVLMLAV